MVEGNGLGKLLILSWKPTYGLARERCLWLSCWRSVRVL